jgi:exodeoxyribonuclease (lambda-induced)
MQVKRDIIQGSGEWLEIKKGVASCSNFSKILTPKTEKQSATLEKYAKELALELAYISTKAGFKSYAMETGNELEPQARQAYQEKKLVKVEQVGIILSDCSNYGYSPDGLVGDDGLIEIKCLEASAHSDFFLKDCKEMPDDYKCQVQGGLWISERKWCDFIVYNKEIKDVSKRLIIIRVLRDEAFIEKLKEGVLKTIKLRDDFLSKICHREEFESFGQEEFLLAG